MSFLVTATIGSAMEIGISTLSDDLLGIQSETGYLEPSRDDLDVSERAFGALLRAHPAGGPATDLAGLGFRHASVRLPDGSPAAVFSDPPGDVRGRGYYVIAKTGAPVLLQAPHRFRDLDSGDVVLALIARRPVRAVAWNTVPRWPLSNRADRTADVAHIDQSYFNRFTSAFAAAYPSGAVVQVHGFAQEKRRSAAGRTADVILSDGTVNAGELASSVARCLTTATDLEVRLYGVDIDELGATTNRNAARLRDRGFSRFVHVELSRPLRRRLLSDPDLASVFSRCLF